MKPKKKKKHLITVFVEREYGARCKEYEASCACCAAWAAHDYLLGRERKDETISVFRHPRDGGWKSYVFTWDFPKTKKRRKV